MRIMTVYKTIAVSSLIFNARKCYEDLRLLIMVPFLNEKRTVTTVISEYLKTQPPKHLWLMDEVVSNQFWK